MFFYKEPEVKPNFTGYLYKAHVLHQILAPGKYKFRDYNDELKLYSLPQSVQSLTVTGQEVLTRDQIALRFSFYAEYQITDGQKLLSSFDPDYALYYFNQKLTVELKLAFRNVIAAFSSEELNEKRTESDAFLTDFTALNERLAPMGVTVLRASVIDLTFPKFIQALFAKQLEAKIRSKTDLENARTAVAAARTLKNASELAKGDEYIRFIQFMELLNKLSEQGKHTFEISLKDWK